LEFRSSLDRCQKKNAQFTLTGSANPDENIMMHSGAGYFTILVMRTICWQEMGFSEFSVYFLFINPKIIFI
jgi:hypothetical protein